MADMRAVQQRLAPFMKEDGKRSALAFWTTWGATAGAMGLAIAVDHWAVRVPVCIFLGFIFARLFVIYHDAEHGAIFRNSPFMRGAMRAFGYAVMSAPAVWKEGHTEHHRETGSHDIDIGGEFPIWSIERYRKASLIQKIGYRISRHPVTVACGYISAFFIGSCVIPLVLNPRKNWRAALSLAVHATLIAGLVALGGWSLALSIFVGPAFIGAAIGIYLIYVQHNAPAVVYAAPGKRGPIESAVKTTTFFRMGLIMRWATANIGFHNVHHMAPKIPFYNLPAATAALPEFRELYVETSWKLRDMLDAFRANLFDPATGRMAPYSVLQAR